MGELSMHIEVSLIKHEFRRFRDYDSRWKSGNRPVLCKFVFDESAAAVDRYMGHSYGKRAVSFKRTLLSVDECVSCLSVCPQLCC